MKLRKSKQHVQPPITSTVRFCLQLSIGGLLFTLFVFVCVRWYPTHIVLRFCFVFVHHVSPVLPVSLDCPFLIAPSVFPNVYLYTTTNGVGYTNRLMGSQLFLISKEKAKNVSDSVFVLEVSILPLFTILIFNFGIGPPV